MEYDSSADTMRHILKVSELTNLVVSAILARVKDHDASKLSHPEKTIFDKYTPMLSGLTYGSDEYKATLAEMKIGIDHHYLHNAHHPENHLDGISGMSLIDIVEMFCDWKAATMRHNDGDLSESIAINSRRFGMNEQLVSIFENTKKELGW